MSFTRRCQRRWFLQQHPSDSWGLMMLRLSRKRRRQRRGTREPSIIGSAWLPIAPTPAAQRPLSAWRNMLSSIRGAF